MAALRRAAVVCVALALALTVPLFAQEPTNEFRPVLPGELGQEALPAAPLVFAAYAFVWVVFVVYLFLLWQRMKRVDADLKEVSARLGASRG